VKIGGSLLDLPDLPTRLHTWLGHRRVTGHVLLVGGGALADVLRRQHAIRPLNEVAAHWACIELMAINARLVSAELNLPTVKYSDLRSDVHAQFLDVIDFMENVEPIMAGRKLPAGWLVSSDSIAARMAIVLDADELLLLKSSECPRQFDADLSRLAATGYIDEFLPQLWEGQMPLQFVNLRITA
jgi:aspartokinase-like uncharacterized kinase